MNVPHPRVAGDPFRGPIDVESSHPLAITEALALLSVPHAIEPLGGALDALVSGAQLRDVNVVFFRYGVSTRMAVPPTGDQVCWVIPLAPMRVDSGDGLEPQQRGFVLGRQTPTTLIPHPFRGAVAITCSIERLRWHHIELQGNSASIEFEVFSGPTQSTGLGLIDSSWKYAARLLDVSSGITPSTASALEHIMLTALVHELPSNAEEFAVSPSRRPASARAHALRAADWVESRLDQPVAITDWAAAVGVSTRYLQRVFRDVHGVTPHQFLLQLRLERARSLLYAGRVESVSDAANQTGFAHLGRFAATYKQAFGEYPSQVIRQRAGRD